MQTLQKTMKGFSLIELLVVLVILALLGGLVVTNVRDRSESAKSSAAAASVDRLSMAVDEFYLDTGRVPRDLRELIEEPSNVSNWNGPYVKTSLMNDPWGNPYQYRFPGEVRDFDIISLGADGAPGGEDANRDVSNAD